MNPPADTVVACLTPPGTAAIATLGLHGPEAWTVARALFRPQTQTELPSDATPGRFWYGRLTGDVSDDVLLTLKSLTPVPWVEIHCHGGRQVVRGLLDTLQTRGLRVYTWQEYLARTLGAPFQGGAAIALADAPTTRTAAILLDQYHGALDRALVEVADARLRGDSVCAQQRLTELARWIPLGRHLTMPWRVVVAGAPNVGKSSLVNALAGFARCVVAPTPGTTRDVVRTLIAVDGWPVELADTAGLRKEAGALEQAGMELAKEARTAADVVLWVLDGSAVPSWPTFDHPALLPLVNKCDLQPLWAPEASVLRVSARTGEGLDRLCHELARRLVPEAPPPGAAVPFTPALCDELERLRQSAER